MGKISIKGEYIFTPSPGTEIIKITLPTIPEYPNIPDQIKYVKISVNRTYKLNAVKYMSSAVSAGIVGYGLASHIKTWVEYIKWNFPAESYEPINATIEWSEEINRHKADIEDLGVPDPGPYKGLAGLQVFDSKGNLSLDISKRLVRYFGSFEINDSAGVHKDKALIGLDQKSLWIGYDFFVRCNTEESTWWNHEICAQDIGCVFPDLKLDSVKGEISWSTKREPDAKRYMSGNMWSRLIKFDWWHTNPTPLQGLPSDTYKKAFKIIIYYGAF